MRSNRQSAICDQRAHSGHDQAAARFQVIYIIQPVDPADFIHLAEILVKLKADTVERVPLLHHVDALSWLWLQLTAGSLSVKSL